MFSNIAGTSHQKLLDHHMINSNTKKKWNNQCKEKNPFYFGTSKRGCCWSAIWLRNARIPDMQSWKPQDGADKPSLLPSRLSKSLYQIFINQARLAALVTIIRWSLCSTTIWLSHPNLILRMIINIYTGLVTMS